MRLSILPVLLAGASVVSLVAAEPIRAIEDTNDNIRFGHELANANVNGNDDSVAHIIPSIVPISPSPHHQGKDLGRHFCGASLREKAIRLSNAFRHALGMSLIKTDIELPKPGRVHVLPIGYPNVVFDGLNAVEGKPRGRQDGGEGHDDPEHRKHHHKHHHHKHHHKHHKSFLRRIQHAIKSLGPWEGRAVAFVLGCGIGVLLRMFWVLSVLAYRTVRGEREETLDREYIVYEQPPDTLFVSPHYFDEKVSWVGGEGIEERK